MPGEECKHEQTWSVYSRTMRDALEVSGVHINFENLLTVNCTVKVDCVLILRCLWSEIECRPVFGTEIARFLQL